MSIDERIQEIKTKIIGVIKKYPVNKAGLFGSVLTDKFSTSSDIDILIEFDNTSKLGLYDIFKIEDELEDSLNRKVDLVQYRLIKPALKSYILPNEQKIYEKNNSTLS